MGIRGIRMKKGTRYINIPRLTPRTGRWRDLRVTTSPRAPGWSRSSDLGQREEAKASSRARPGVDRDRKISINEGERKLPPGRVPGSIDIKRSRSMKGGR